MLFLIPQRALCYRVVSNRLSLHITTLRSRMALPSEWRSTAERCRGVSGVPLEISAKLNGIRHWLRSHRDRIILGELSGGVAHLVRSTTGYFAVKPPACRSERGLFAEISKGTLGARGRLAIPSRGSVAAALL